jgi:hypothetical protein
VSVLRKEEPLTTADIANQPRGATTRADVVDETSIDPADRRPPQSAGARSAASPAVDDAVAAADQGDQGDRDDTYDGEIVNSTVDPAPRMDMTDNIDSRSQSASVRQTASRPSPAGKAPGATQTSSANAQAERNESPLFDENELRDFRDRWDQIQTSFVDEPRHAVEHADTLVATVVKRIAEQFSEERAKLEQQWDRGDNVSTEDLRQGFKRYRAFFDRLLAF